MNHLTRNDFARAIELVVGQKLPGQPVQYVDEISLAPNYVIGSREVVGMTVYHYGKLLAGSAVDVTNQGRGFGNSLGLDEQNTSAAPVSVAVGSRTLPILDAASAAHLYSGGTVTVYPAGAEVQRYDIIDSTVSDGTNVVLTLARPVRVAIAAGTFTALVRNPYSAVSGLATIGTGLAPVVGVPQRYATAGYYMWFATWGLANIVQGEALNGTNGPDVCFSPADGAVWKASTVHTAGNSWQRAGHMILEQTSGIDSNIWLELDP